MFLSEFFGFVFSTIAPQICFHSFITDTLQTEQLLASLNEHSHRQLHSAGAERHGLSSGH